MPSAMPVRAIRVAKLCPQGYTGSPVPVVAGDPPTFSGLTNCLPPSGFASPPGGKPARVAGLTKSIDYGAGTVTLAPLRSREVQGHYIAALCPRSGLPFVKKELKISCRAGVLSRSTR